MKAQPKVNVAKQKISWQFNFCCTLTVAKDEELKRKIFFIYKILIWLHEVTALMSNVLLTYCVFMSLCSPEDSPLAQALPPGFPAPFLFADGLSSVETLLTNIQVGTQHWLSEMRNQLQRLNFGEDCGQGRPGQWSSTAFSGVSSDNELSYTARFHSFQMITAKQISRQKWQQTNNVLLHFL